MEPVAQTLPIPLDEAIVHARVQRVLDSCAIERDERIRTARILVVGPLLGAASWLLLGGAVYVVIRLLP